MKAYVFDLAYEEERYKAAKFVTPHPKTECPMDTILEKIKAGYNWCLLYPDGNVRFYRILPKKYDWKKIRKSNEEYYGYRV